MNLSRIIRDTRRLVDFYNAIGKEAQRGGDLSYLRRETKRWTVYAFPARGGSPRSFRFKFFAWLYALHRSAIGGVVCELKDNRTGEYFAYCDEEKSVVAYFDL